MRDAWRAPLFIAGGALCVAALALAGPFEIAGIVGVGLAATAGAWRWREGVYLRRARSLLRAQRSTWAGALGGADEITDEARARIAEDALEELIAGLRGLTPPGRLHAEHDRFVATNEILLLRMRAYREVARNDPGSADKVYEAVQEAEAELDLAEMSLFFV